MAKDRLAQTIAEIATLTQPADFNPLTYAAAAKWMARAKKAYQHKG